MRGFWNRHAYAQPKMLQLCGLSCVCTICWWREPAIVIVVGSWILIGVSMVDIMAYVCGLAIDMTKLVSCEEV